MKVRIGFIGVGWRAHGYMRVVEEFRHRMEVSGILDSMARYAAGGEEVYPLKEALQDTYLHLMLDESIRQGCPLTTTTQSWAK